MAEKTKRLNRILLESMIKEDITKERIKEFFRENGLKGQ